MKDEEGVSPVIAVILMVAITVVLAATVFVLVNELGQDVGQTGPTLGMASSQATSENWQVRITSLTASTPLDQFNCILTTPNGEVTAGACDEALWGQTDDDPITHDYELVHAETGVAGDLSVGDRLSIRGGEACLLDASGECDEDFSTPGRYTFELVHRPTGTSSGSISRTV